MFFTIIFMDKKNEIPTSCCQKLVDMGEEWHDTINGSVFSMPDVRLEKFEFLEKWQNRNFDYKIVNFD